MPRKEIWRDDESRGLKRNFRGTIMKCDFQNLDPDWKKPTLKRAL